ncbi:MAM and LDL-receptor class A domain-containing protein 1 isoform X1 [Petromyzon marinus]|uniref:MAM and LDL-receptor class A domain-containing protein 1 isoform X1 n=1 Tax=Petromyzon marinus TaxID=7757 RepID=UPI003F6F8176
MKRMVVVVCVLLAAATSLQARGPPPSHPPPLPWTPERWSSAPPQQQNESMGGSTPPSSVEEEEHRGGGFEDLVTCCNLSPQQNHHPSFSNDTTNCALECSLEDSRGWCGWEGGQSKESFTWTRETWDQLGPRVRNMSPLLDHTTNSSAGHMLVVIMNGTSGNRVAELRSPCLHSAGPDCTVSFWYYRHGPFVGPMELWLSEDKSETLLWYEPYEQPGSWLHAQVWLGRRAGPFRVSLRKLELGRYVGATAVDDLALVGCALPPPRAECPSTEPPAFRCSRSGACVEACLRCDLTDHCGDGSDEEDCDWTQQCDFESGLCDWRQASDDEDDFDWTLQRGPSSTPLTGPYTDHTLGTGAGTYLYIEASEPQAFGDRAVLMSRAFGPVSESAGCALRLHYHMWGRNVYRLAVYRRSHRNGRGQLLWARYGNRGDRWVRGNVTLAATQPFQVLVEGVVGDDYHSDIAIDDLSFINCPLFDGELPLLVTPTNPVASSTLLPNDCTKGEFVCRSDAACLSPGALCNFREDCADGSDEAHCVLPLCGFTDGVMCFWTVLRDNVGGGGSSNEEDGFRWSLGQGATVYPMESDHRPTVDHTTGEAEGWYLYADSSSGKFWEASDLVTPTIGRSGPNCHLVFWYHMEGVSIGLLQVLVSSMNVTYPLWMKNGDQGAGWRQARVLLGVRVRFQVIVRVRKGVGYLGDLAIDDLEFSDCAPPEPGTELCSASDFPCHNGLCVPAFSLCDFNNDCIDNSDEAPQICAGYPGHCNFEFDLCTWRQWYDADDADWTLSSGSSPLGGGGPMPTDHTLRDPRGHYLSLESTFPRLPGQLARISVPPISAGTRDCKLLFHYCMLGKGVGSLRIYRAELAGWLVSALDGKPQLSGRKLRRQPLSFSSASSSSSSSASSSTEALDGEDLELLVEQDGWQLLLNLTDQQEDAVWQREEVILDAPYPFSVIIEGLVGTGSRTAIALDDITFSMECTPVVVPPNNGSGDHDHCRRDQRPCATGGQCVHEEQLCDFRADCEDGSDESECGSACTFEQGDTCGWENSQSDCFNWVLGRGSPHGPRPPVDHTLGSEQGHFFFLEPTQSGRQGDKGHLKSGEFHQSSRLCTLSFWYYVSSATSGSLRIIVKTEYNLIEMWRSQPGEQVGVWRQALVPLKRLRNFVVILEGVRTHNYAGGTAIDDIDFLHCSPEDGAGSCLLSTDFHCANGQCVEPRITCDYKDDCGDNSDEVDCVSVAGSCDFNERGDEERNDVWCGWRNREEHNDFTWVLEPRGVSHGTGPTEDHTPNLSGGFLRVDTAGRSVGQRAGLVAPSIFPASFGLCRLRFWFFMSGSGHKAALRVYSQGESGAPILMFVARGDMGTQWKYANIEVSHSVPFRVVFEAEAGSEQPGSIALDDVSFTPSCNLTGAMCPENWYWCGEHQRMCLPSELVCDGREDCPGGSDEEHCPTPSLDTGCPPSTFLCGNGSCTPAAPLCYDPADCLVGQGDASDCWCWDVDCRNEGVCVLNGTTGICRCAHGWQGEHCLLPTPDAAHPSARPSRQNPAYSIEVWAAVVIAAALLLPLVLLAAFIQQRRRLQALSELDDDSFPIIKTDAWPKSDLTKLARSRRHGTQPSSFCNPLYRRHSDPTVGTAPVGLPATSRGRPDRYAQLCTLRQVGWPHGESHL